jgi:hypothetical protein
MTNGFLLHIANLFRLRGGPQNLPASWPLVIALLLVYIGQNLATGQQLDDQNAAAKSLLAISLQIFILTGLLNWKHCIERFTQTLTALVAVGIIFNFMTWLLLIQSDPTTNQPFLALVWFGIFFWSLFVDANIYRHALSLDKLAHGMLITVLALAVSYVLIESLFLGGANSS